MNITYYICDMKKLLLILLCLPMIGFGQIVWESDFSNPADWAIDNTGSFTNEGWSIDATMDSWFLSAFSSTSGGNFAELGNGDPNATGWNGPIQVEYAITTANPILEIETSEGVINKKLILQ